MVSGSSAQYIVREPGIHGGEPVVEGTRVPVRSIVVAYDRSGDLDHVAQSFSLDRAQVEAALAYYREHEAEIDHIIEEREQDTLA